MKRTNLGAFSILLLICGCQGTGGSHGFRAPAPTDVIVPTSLHADYKPLKHRPLPKVGSFVSPDVTLAADHVIAANAGPRTIEISASLARGKQTIPLVQLEFRAVGGVDFITDSEGQGQGLCAPGSTIYLEARLQNDAYKIVGHYMVYVLKLKAQCGHVYELTFEENSKAGNVMSIQETVERARTKLAAEVGLEFWNDQLTFSWPERSTFYALSEVDLIHGSQYEVVGHELGHAVADLASINVNSPFVGTQASTGEAVHYIDRCYNAPFAFSEGWATFFSAWLNLDPKNPAASFSQISPRRAPIDVVQVPGDVCQGPANEWRVTAFLWSLIDQTSGAQPRYTFAQIWDALRDRSPVDTKSAAGMLEVAGFSPAVVDGDWQISFLQKL